MQRPESLDRRALAVVRKRDRQAGQLGSLVDASYRLARRIEITSTTFDLRVRDKMREAAMNARGTIVMLEEARDTLHSGRS